MPYAKLLLPTALPGRFLPQNPGRVWDGDSPAGHCPKAWLGQGTGTGAGGGQGVPALPGLPDFL